MFKNFSCFLILNLGVLHAQEPLGRDETGIPGPIADGARGEPVPEPELPDFEVIRSVTGKRDVVEAAEMVGLPPVRGRINVTVQLVEDPGLPDPPEPLAAVPPDDPAVVARLRALREKYRDRRIAYVSATVFDHSRTYIRCYPAGEADKVISAWSNLDFNHFSGFGSYQVKDTDEEIREYILFMGIGDTDTKRIAARLAEHDRTYVAPEAPTLPDLAAAGPSFVIVEGDQAAKEPMELLRGMHDLYRVEGPRMEAAYLARIKAQAERKAWLLENPPVPEDIVIRFWKPKDAAQVPAGMEGGSP